jgi:hypothetical protein
MTHIYLAVSGGWGNVQAALDSWDWAARPLNLLIAFPYLRKFLGDLKRWSPARLMLDSGAFSAWQSGHAIDLDALALESKNPRWDEAVALDVIGSWRGSMRNAIAMRILGSPAMPVFHVDDPWEALDMYCEKWPKVGLGGMVGRDRSDVLRWVEGVFKRRWPHRFHAFGRTEEPLTTAYPFHSADSTSWTVPVAFARGVRIRGAKVGRVVGVPDRILQPTLQYSIESFLELEEKLRARWAGELARFA